MGWSWDQFEDCPYWVVEVLLAQLQEDADKREAEKQLADLKRRHGR